MPRSNLLILVLLTSVFMVELLPTEDETNSPPFVWNCYCDRLCRIVKHFMTPLILQESRSGRSMRIPGVITPSLGVWEWLRNETGYLGTILRNGFDRVAAEVSEFGNDIEDSIAVLAIAGERQVRQYYNDVMVHHAQNDPLMLFCDKTRSLGYCKCSLQEI